MAGTGAEFVELEEIDAVRMVWNVWPYSRLEAAKCVIPFGVLHTPVKQTANLQVSLILLLEVILQGARSPTIISQITESSWLPTLHCHTPI